MKRSHQITEEDIFRAQNQRIQLASGPSLEHGKVKYLIWHPLRGRYIIECGGYQSDVAELSAAVAIYNLL